MPLHMLVILCDGLYLGHALPAARHEAYSVSSLRPSVLKCLPAGLVHDRGAVQCMNEVPSTRHCMGPDSRCCTAVWVRLSNRCFRFTMPDMRLHAAVHRSVASRAMCLMRRCPASRHPPLQPQLATPQLLQVQPQEQPQPAPALQLHAARSANAARYRRCHQGRWSRGRLGGVTRGEAMRLRFRRRSAAAGSSLSIRIQTRTMQLGMGMTTGIRSG